MRIVDASITSLSNWPFWPQLEHELKEESGFDDIGNRMSAPRLRERYFEGLAVLGLDVTSMPIGFVAAWPAENEELEIGSAWVKQEYRGHGWGTALTQRLILLRRVLDAPIFAISQTEAFWHVAKRTGLRIHHDWRDPISWASTCAPCSKADDKDQCPHRNGQCKLFIR